MTLSPVLTCFVIIIARIADVSFGTMRTVFIVQGRKGIAFVLAFLEVTIWVVVVSKVIQNLSQPEYVASFALGFALGTYLGITMENWLAVGDQVVRIFTRRGTQVARKLRSAGYRVTEFDGKGQGGPVSLLFIKTTRRSTSRAIEVAETIDPRCFYVIDDVRLTSGRKVRFHTPTGWRAIAKKK
jgi:uncharacterized protein YebE (UPF0316 family)